MGGQSCISVRRKASACRFLALLLLSAAPLSCRPAGATPAPRPVTHAPSLPPAPIPTSTEPILPLPPASAGTASHPPTRAPQASTLPVPAATPIPPTPGAGLYTARQRLGLGAAGLSVTRRVTEQLGFGWYVDWRVTSGSYHSGQVEYMPMIRLAGGRPSPSEAALRKLVPTLPGALWLIGNEPDVKWQDNVTPEAYARAYHDLYLLLKSLDPTCRVAVGGVSQPTPLRLKYLEQILDAYQAHYGTPMPVDVWNVHNFILREERGSWGVDIPPGISGDAGILRELEDHGSLDLFRQQIVDFRRWMKAQGLQDKPLIVTEYGILMPNDYGFPPERVEHFMLDTFAYLGSAVDPALGMPADGGRLVQRWCWFSLADDRYPTGNLLEAEGTLTPLGEAFAEYARQLP